MHIKNNKLNYNLKKKKTTIKNCISKFAKITTKCNNFSLKKKCKKLISNFRLKTINLLFLKIILRKYERVNKNSAKRII